MLAVSFEQMPAFRIWACRKLEIPSLLPMSTTITVLRDGAIAGVGVYSNFTGPDIWISIAGEGRWLSRYVIPLFFKYPFNQLGCRRLSAFCRDTNVHAIEFAERFGFVQEGILRSYYEDGADCIVLGLLREDCKWVTRIHRSAL